MPTPTQMSRTVQRSRSESPRHSRRGVVLDGDFRGEEDRRGRSRSRGSSDPITVIVRDRSSRDEPTSQHNGTKQLFSQNRVVNVSPLHVHIGNCTHCHCNYSEELHRRNSRSMSSPSIPGINIVSGEIDDYEDSISQSSSGERPSTRCFLNLKN